MRFLAPDDVSPFSTGGLNAYAYCSDDPVNHSDPTGHSLMKVQAKSYIGITKYNKKMSFQGEGASTKIIYINKPEADGVFFAYTNEKRSRTVPILDKNLPAFLNNRKTINKYKALMKSPEGKEILKALTVNLSTAAIQGNSPRPIKDDNSIPYPWGIVKNARAANKRMTDNAQHLLDMANDPKNENVILRTTRT